MKMHELRAVRIGLVLMVAGSSLALGNAASGHSESWAVSVTATFYDDPASTDSVTGEIRSLGGARCTGDRDVWVYKVRRGRDRLVAYDVSDYDSFFDVGHFEARLDNPRDGKYYVRVRTLDYESGSAHDHICLGARSSTMVVDDDPTV